MAITATKISGPSNIAPNFKLAVYEVLMDNSYPTGGEVVDLTADFTYIDAITFGGNDTAADNRYRFSALLPAVGTAITSSNVLVQCHWSGTAGAGLDEFTNTGDLSSIGELRMVVMGR